MLYCLTWFLYQISPPRTTMVTEEVNLFRIKLSVLLILMLPPWYQVKSISSLQRKEIISTYIAFYPFQECWSRLNHGPSRRVQSIWEVTEIKKDGNFSGRHFSGFLPLGTSGAPEVGQRESNQQLHPPRVSIVMEILRAEHTIDSVIYILWVLGMNCYYK